jgi:hypothetical protein
MKRLAVLAALLAISAAPFHYSMTKPDGIGEQLKAEIIDLPTVPDDGWNVDQDDRTGVIRIEYDSTVNLTAQQKQAVLAAINSHTPNAAFSDGDDPNELLLQKMSYADRHWDQMTPALKDKYLRMAGRLVRHAMGRR